MRVARSIEVDRDPGTVWRYVADVSRYPDFVVGVTRWEPVGEGRYWVLMQVGSIATGGEVAVTVDPGEWRVHWDSLRGTRHHASLQVEELGGGRSRLGFALTFALLGMAGPVTERLAAPLVRRNLVASLETARHQLEHEYDPRVEGDA